MNNDLSNQLRSLNTFEWMARPATTKQICFDAADRIEKLEAALIDILKVPRSEASWGIALVIAHHALKEGKDV